MIPLDEVVQQILLWVVTGVLGALGGWTISTLKHSRGESQAIKEGIRSLLRSEIKRMRDEAVRNGYCTVSDREVMERNYRAYHNLDGNGVATKLYEEFVAVPTRED